MRWLYGGFLILMVFVSACAQQTEPVAPEPEPEPAEGTGAAVAPQIEETVNEIRYVGSGGFDPKELTISAGSAVTWINSDSKAGGLLIFKDGRSFTTAEGLLLMANLSMSSQRLVYMTSGGTWLMEL